MCGETRYESEQVMECFAEQAGTNRFAGTGSWSVRRTHFSMDERGGTDASTAPALNNITSLADCVEMCACLCPRCRYVSYSRRNHDCSAYAKCDMRRLAPSPGETGYVSVAVRQGAALEEAVCGSA